MPYSLILIVLKLGNLKCPRGGGGGGVKRSPICMHVDRDCLSTNHELASPSRHQFYFLCSKQLSMASGKNTREYLTIRRNLSLIIDSLAATVDPARLAVKLLEVDLIPHDVVDHASVVGVLSARQRIQPIVLALESQIQLDVSNYQVLMRVLRTIHPCLAERLEKFYSKYL